MVILNFISKITKIQKGEYINAFLAFIYFYFTITAYYILKPARNSLYIEYLGADNKPYATMFIAIVAFFMIIPYVRFAKKNSNNKVVSIFLLFSIVSMFVFHWAFMADYGKLFSAVTSFVFYTWLTLFSSFTVMQFWNLLNDLFDSQASKRLYGFVGSGGILGGITGSKIARLAAGVGTEKLFFIAAAYILLILLIFNFIWYRQRNKNIFKVKRKKSEDEKFIAKELFVFLRESKYLFYVLLIVGLIKFVTAQTEWQFDKFVDISNFSKDYMTSFYGRINEYLGYAALFVQIILTSKVLKKLGFKYALIPLPAGLFIGTLILLITPALWAMAIIKISEGSLRYSINQSAQNYLYLPILRHIRYRLKPFIDVVVYQFAKGSAGLFQIFYLFLVRDLLSLSLVAQAYLIGYINLLFLLIWFYAINRVQKEYPSEIKKFLINSENTDNTIAFYNDYHKRFLNESDLNIINNEGLAREIVVKYSLSISLLPASSYTDDIVEITNNYLNQFRNYDFSYLNDLEFDMLIKKLMSENTKSARYEILQRINALKCDKLKLFKNEIENQILKEFEYYHNVLNLALLYKFMIFADKTSGLKIKFIIDAFHKILYDTILRIILLLKLLYCDEDLDIVCNRIFSNNNYIRANAIELLHCIVKDKVLRCEIDAVFDGDCEMIDLLNCKSVKNITDKEIHNILTSAIENEDIWINFTALIMIYMFEFKQFYNKIEHIKNKNNFILNVVDVLERRSC